MTLRFTGSAEEEEGLDLPRPPLPHAQLLRAPFTFCGIMQTWTNLAAVSPNTKQALDHGTGCTPHSVALKLTSRSCKYSTSMVLLFYSCQPLSIALGAWEPHHRRRITITNHHKPLSPFTAVLAPTPHTPHGGSEAPRGPHPGTGHRNRTIFSPGQAEALEKGARVGADGGLEGAWCDPWKQCPWGLWVRLWMALAWGGREFRVVAGGSGA